MKTSWKIYLTVLLFFILDFVAGYILYTKAWTKVLGKNLQIPFVKHTIQPTPQNSATKIYANPKMHISFAYPQNLALKEINSSLISLETPTSTATDSSLFIFETTLTNKQNVVDIPFVIKGKIKTQVAIPVHDFTAKQITYTDGLVLITLRKNDQFIMVRIPKDSTYVEDAITDFVDTIKILQ